jgi:hypothetical protein
MQVGTLGKQRPPNKKKNQRGVGAALILFLAPVRGQAPKGKNFRPSGMADVESSN